MVTIKYDNLNLNVKKEKYVGNDRLAVALYLEDGRLFQVITKNFPGVYIGPDQNVSFVDENNVPQEIIRELVKREIMWPTEEFVESGFCVYTLYGFDLDALE